MKTSGITMINTMEESENEEEEEPEDEIAVSSNVFEFLIFLKFRSVQKHFPRKILNLKFRPNIFDLIFFTTKNFSTEKILT